MNDDSEPVGSVGEEAAKLLGAFTDWARTHDAEGAAEALRHVDSHVAGDDCRFCPVCQVIHAVRETSPEVKEHLASAAASLMQAAAGLLATRVPPPGTRPSPVQKIDLGDDGPWDVD